MHGTRYELLQAQARAAGLPLWEVPLPWPCSNDVYEGAMAAACTSALQKGIDAVAFGDLFLEEVRRYREERLRGTGLEPIFPLWGRNTHDLIHEMLDGGLRARIVCVDPAKVSAEFIGCDLDEQMLRRLPASVDPCGENGEFHTFAYAGPMFREPIPIENGKCVTRDGFLFADIVLGSEPHDSSPRRHRDSEQILL